MNERKAKRIRRRIYGEMAIEKTKYVRHRETGQIRCVGLRAQYKLAKKDAKK